ncbi:unnamed protein product [Soboliphyme baturini]|uniref:Efflux RND transporter permease subunit n=1 Tax=Soboliphyme baturini TaxID=241478 RepID=A0A183IJN9_9BILA|nr:unnamed protein product [Soboliphyme baturini]
MTTTVVRPAPTVADQTGRFASYVEKTVALSEYIRKSYALFLNDRPITVYFVTAFLLGSLTALGIHLNPLPDFSAPTLGFDTRGTVLSGRVQAWNALDEKTAYYPESNKEFFRQLPPSDVIPR